MNTMNIRGIIELTVKNMLKAERILEELDVYLKLTGKKRIHVRSGKVEYTVYRSILHEYVELEQDGTIEVYDEVGWEETYITMTVEEEGIEVSFKTSISEVRKAVKTLVEKRRLIEDFVDKTLRKQAETPTMKYFGLSGLEGKSKRVIARIYVRKHVGYLHDISIYILEDRGVVCVVW